MDGFYAWLEWFDNYEGFEYITLGVSGLAFLVMLWTWGYRVGKARWFNACKRAVEQRENMSRFAQDIIHGYDTSDKIKVSSLDKLTRREI